MGVEVVWCELSLGHERVLAGCLYRPPTHSESKTTDDQIIACLAAISDALESGEITGLILAGDFNLPEVSWEDGLPHVHGNENSAGHRLVDAFEDLYLCQGVSKPSFTQANGDTKHVLDLVLFESQCRVNEVRHGPGLGSTRQHHHLLSWTYQLQSTISKTDELPRLNYAKGCYDDMNAYLGSVDWPAMFDGKSFQDSYDIFVDTIKRAERRFIPLSRRRPGKSAPWIDHELKKLIKEKRRLWQIVRACRNKDEVKLLRYKELVKLVKNRITCSVENYESSLAFDKKNPKRVYHYIKMRQKTRQGLDLLTDADKVYTSPEVIANIMNNHFASCFTPDPVMDDLPVFPSRSNSSISDCEFTVEDVSRRLEALDASKSPGGDELHAAVFKRCAWTLAVPLCYFFRRSMDEGVLPVSWSEANVTPLYKKGDRAAKENYRPISLTSIACKTMERIVRDNIMFHLFQNNLLSKEQHGFVPRKSCVTNLLESADLLTRSLAARENLDVLYLDFSKAFDTVSHKLLMVKLAAYGVAGNVLRWIEKFLANRRQRVVMGTARSEWVGVTSGVPQGSVLGPLLFTIYINDLPDMISSICKLYADDSKLFASNAVELQQDIHAVTSWCNTWLMRLNASKCHILHIGKHNPHVVYHVDTAEGRAELTVSKTERDLGVEVSETLHVGEQVHKAASKANAMLGLMKKTFVTRDSTIWKKIYTTHVRPHLEYAVQAWCPYQRGDINKLEKVQRRASKIPYKLRNSEYEERLVEWDLTTLEKRRERGDLIQMYKLEEGVEVVEWQEEQPRGVSIGGRRTQMRREIVRNCAQRHNFFTNRVVNPWNSLPDQVVHAPSVNSFKARLDDFNSTTIRAR